MWLSIAILCIYTIVFTGMRPGEAGVLKYEDVDLEKKIIHISKTVYAKKSIRDDFSITPKKHLEVSAPFILMIL